MKRSVFADIIASEGAYNRPPRPGAVSDIKTAMQALPAPQQPAAFMDLGDVEAVTDHSVKLMGLTGLALDRARDILAGTPDPADERYGDELRAQTSTIKTVLTTQLRVDENQLRRRTVDALPELLKQVALEEKRLQQKGIGDALQLEVA